MPHISTQCECCLSKSKTSRLNVSGASFVLCTLCLKHLKKRALLPLEWYRLITHHSTYSEYISNDYYYTNGISILPEIEREMTGEFNLPHFNQVKHDLNQLIDYMLFPYNTTDYPSLIEALRHFPPEDILKRLTFLMETYPSYHVIKYCFQICVVLVDYCKDEITSFIKSQWQAEQKIAFSELVRVSMHCFPADDVFEWTTQLIQKHPHQNNALAYLPREKALSWLEENITPPFLAWGSVAAKLHLTWSIIEKWLQQGRPMSLVALGALQRMCTDEEPDVKLYQPDSIERMTEVLTHYASNDSAPTVHQAVSSIRSNWGTCLKEGARAAKISGSYHADPFMGKLDRIHDINSYHIKKFAKITIPSEITTRFGGQPHWLNEPEWPISRGNGKPMHFIGQVVLDTQLFPETTAKVAYLFITEDDCDNTWEPNEGENAVILQPGENSFINSASQQTGATLSQTAYSPILEQIKEPDYIPLNALSALLPVREQKAYYKAIDGNKIGGLPRFMQSEYYPSPDQKWNLLLQLDSTSMPFFINFGDGGMGYVFLSADGTSAKFLWQCL